MRRLKKTSAAIAAAALLLGGGLTACGSKDTGASGKGDPCSGGKGPKVGLAYDIGGRGDQSFNDAAWAGMEKALKELDASCKEVKAAADDDNAARAERLRTLAEAGFNPVIGVGFAYSEAAAAVAPDYPDTDFAVIDGYSQFVKESKNLVDLTFAEEQGSFLVGVAAALKSQKKHVGFLGGTHGDLIKKFEAGYTAGVHAVDPKIKVDVKYLTEDPNDNATGFENPAGGKTAAEGLFDGGADVVYHAAGKSGLGLFQAVAEKGDGYWAIGVDSDQYLTAAADQKPHILTSMLKRVDTAVFDVISEVKDDSFKGGNKTYDLKLGGVGYSKSGGFVDDIADQIDGYAEKIKSGEIKVPTAPKG
ncbi:BMP family lipoprotein [Nocardioides marmoribigeumensis]|uniref:Basic membrane protein A n=1 Tax=Nocardioides marmoribigeumensis TaxID=433649 RepID=A0ABU2BZZ4_9ACTN|nr:BMP family ABC transporter substrate-binding protein [Nocardioides marmoribigeumensis]MDR7363949.1 basic membrane protein A [Nocardioides marmoribigeumensis]